MYERPMTLMLLVIGLLLIFDKFRILALL